VSWYVEYLASLVVLLIMHEAAHAVVARLLGFPVREVRIGRSTGGQRVATIGGVPIYVGLGFNGVTRTDFVDGPQVVRRRRLVVAAGPAINLVFAPLALLSHGLPQVFGLTALVVGVGSLLPYTSGKSMSDGLQLIRSPKQIEGWRTATAIRRIASGYQPADAAQVLPEVRALASQPESGMQAAYLLAHVSRDAGTLVADAPLLARFSGAEQLTAETRAHIANLVAWDLLCVDGGANHCDTQFCRETADGSSAFAARTVPSCMHLHTRAEVLRRLGRRAEALPYAEQAAATMPADLGPAERDAVLATLAACRVTG
jgi:hypothetical protein